MQEQQKISYLDGGFVKLVDVMGDDKAIVNAAKRSTGGEITNEFTEKDNNLLRYLFRHKHTSPFEMCELKWHLKMPIFVMRQHIRHRTASVNELSGRYSVLPDEFYIPKSFSGQSKINKQQKEGTIAPDITTECVELFKDINEDCYHVYEMILEKGIAREQARMILPVNIYTECFWKINLHNFLHYISLRMDDAAQDEISILAKIMYDTVKTIFPNTCKAFEDYRLNAITLSNPEINLINNFIKINTIKLLEYYNNNKQNFNLTEKEYYELHEKLKKMNFYA